MRVTPEDLIVANEPEDLSALSMMELRAFRDAYQEVEYGLSYVRRVVQGRLDTILAELGRRNDDGRGADLIGLLPEALATHVRGPGLPRPTRDIDLPPWADDMVEELDGILTPTAMARLGELGDVELADAAERVAAMERDVSEARNRLHRRIDRIQEELIGRYRAGASVDDLLG